MSNNKPNMTPEIENRVLSIWQSVLEVKKIARDENFFDAGGNSLLMSKVHREIKRQLGIPINIIELFQCPTVDSLSKNISKKYPQVLLEKSN
ncbi:acyl carrier protein [Vibrio coralliilyticus]|uniref:phosphopantetheine-binding protein n=1 Tax=Vibrio coralliilyticus TaxID=190893 RepID=UPI000BAADE3E|nr:phosphopantetheine-binding protein [Vibrio coralliilyticus]NOI28823.1 acyl carrier protein [Vibrio coralliilyticus]NOI47717.1 acyl carrier protein [Vibrio coralliilyticus]NRF23735.1 acyl carrier protein [Vibrio coralliilyticus]NRF77554.1 acyl carrier protein [Vibrio coralliilyticus]NUW70259.1 acyl carrier protein [Vibrio coralliilyticus]